MSNGTRSKYWCFTKNNYTPEDVSFCGTLFPERVSYVVIGREVGESGTRHLQGYLELPQRWRRSQVITMLPGAHIELRRGTGQQASDYCKKDGDYDEYGNLAVPAQGRRSDLQEVTEAIANGASKRKIAQDFPEQYVKYHKGLEKLIDIHQDLKPANVFHGPFRWNIEPSGSDIFVGESGIGKTEYAKHLMPDALFVTHIDQLYQYDPDVHSGIIFDDMSFKHLPREAQIHLVDYDNHRAIHVRYNTAFIPLGTKKIFTTNVPNGEIFLIADPAIARRIVIHHLE